MNAVMECRLQFSAVNFLHVCTNDGFSIKSQFYGVTYTLYWGRGGGTLAGTYDVSFPSNADSMWSEK